LEISGTNRAQTIGVFGFLNFSIRGAPVSLAPLYITFVGRGAQTAQTIGYFGFLKFPRGGGRGNGSPITFVKNSFSYSGFTFR